MDFNSFYARVWITLICIHVKRDYHSPFVRWTENRNMKSILRLLKSEAINFDNLITHTYPFSDAIKAYDKMKEETKTTIGVIFEYDSNINFDDTKILGSKDVKISVDKINLGVIGAGNYAQTFLLPLISKIKNINTHSPEIFGFSFAVEV